MAALIQHPAGLAPDLLSGDTHFSQHVQGHTFTELYQPKQQVFCADVVVPQFTGFFHGVFERPLYPWREVQLGSALTARCR